MNHIWTKNVIIKLVQFVCVCVCVYVCVRERELACADVYIVPCLLQAVYVNTMYITFNAKYYSETCVIRSLHKEVTCLN